MADTWNVRGNLDTIRQADTGNFTQSRVGLLGGHGTHSSADTTLLRAVQVGVLLFSGSCSSSEGRVQCSFLTRTSRPLRTSWLKVGISFLLSSLIDALLRLPRPLGRTIPRNSRNDYITVFRPNCQEYCQKILKKSCNTENFIFLKPTTCFCRLPQDCRLLLEGFARR